MKKRTLSILLAIVMILSLLPVTAFAATLEDYKNASYYLHPQDLPPNARFYMNNIGDGEFAYVGNFPATGVDILCQTVTLAKSSFLWEGDPDVTIIGNPAVGDQVTFVYKVISETQATMTVTKGKLIYSFAVLKAAFDATQVSSDPVTIRLTQDLKAPAEPHIPLATWAGTNVTFDLNGHVLCESGLEDVECINVMSDSTLTIIDSSPTTEHNGYLDQNGLWHWDEDGTHELRTGEVRKPIKGGIITGGNGYAGVGLTVTANATCIMEGGTICGNYSSDTEVPAEGCVRVCNGATFTMNGGTICNNVMSADLSKGGGVYTYGTFNMNGGTICDNVLSGNSSKGGGVCVAILEESKPTSTIYHIGSFNMNGGTICGNRVSADGGAGGIFASYHTDQGKPVNSKLTFGGTAVVSGNFKGDQASDVGQPAANNADFSVSTATPPKSGMMIGLDTPNIQIKTASAGDTKYFFSDSADYCVNFNNNNTPEVASDDYLELKKIISVSSWAALQEAINGTSGDETTPATETTTIILTQDVTAPAEGSSYIDIPAGKNIILDLNGHTLDRGLSEKEAIREGNVIRAGKDVSLTVKNGTITGSNVTPDINKGALRCQETKKLNLIDVDFANCKNVALFLYGVKSTNIDGCTFSDNTYGGGEVGGAAIDVKSSGIDSQRKEITIKDCLFENNTLTGGSGSAIHLYVEKYDYDTTVINSTFTGNHAGSVESEDDGGAICIYNVSLVLDGCTITGNTAAAEPLNNHCGGVSVAGKTASVTLKGKTVIAGNTCGGNAADLYFKNKETTVKLDGLAEGSKIGVLTAYDIEEGSSAVVATNAASVDAEYFFSDNEKYDSNYNSGNIELTISPAAFSTADTENPVVDADSFNAYVKGETKWNGNTFAGWFYTDDEGKDVEFTGTYDEAAAGTIYTAKWTNAAGKTVLTDPITVKDGDIYIGSSTVPATEDELASYGLAFDKDTATLTMTNASIDTPDGENWNDGGTEKYAALKSDAPLTIVLNGENTIRLGDGDGSRYGVYSDSDLTINGSGSLNVECGSAENDSYGVYADDGITADGADVTGASETFTSGETKSLTQSGTEPIVIRIQPVYVVTTPTVTVPVSGDKGSVNVKATVSGNTATIKPINEEDIQKVIGDDVETGTVVIDLSGTNRTITGAKLPTETVQSIAEAASETGNDTAGLKLELSSGTLEFDATALETIAAAAGDAANIEIHFDEVGTTRLNNVQKEAVSEMDVLEGFEAYVTVNGKRVSDFEGGSVTVYIPYEVPEDKDPAAYTVWYVAEDGTLEKMDTTYDGENHRFVVSHFSDYVLTYDETVGQYNNCPKDDTCPMSKFTDVDMNAWYHDGVHYCLDNGIMAGFPDDLFKPDGTTTRAQIAQILYNLEGQPAFMNDNIFTDVVSGSWYEKAVVWAQGKGIVSGYGDDTFGPNDPITREQLAVILYNYAKYKEIDVTVDENTNFLSFNDFWDTSEWAKPAMMWAIDRELIVGDNWDLNPQDDAVRAQAATIIWKFCENVAE